MKKIKYIYLDTSRLIDLAHKSSIEKPWNDVDKILRKDDVYLLLSKHHLYEFLKYHGDDDYLGEYLDSLYNVKWIIPSWIIWEKEIENALNFVLTNNENTHIDLVYNDLLDTEKRYNLIKQDLKRPKNYIEYLKLFRNTDSKETDTIIQKAVTMINNLKETAEIWKSWETVLGRIVIMNWPKQTTNKLLMVKKDPNLILKVLRISWKFMPSLVFNVLIQRTKFAEKISVEANDLLDEYHASYAPYVDLLMHDHNTCKRAHLTGCSFANVFTDNPSGFTRLINRYYKH